MLERLPFWGQIVVMLALAAGLVGLAYYFYPNIQEKNREIAEIQKQLEDMNAKIVEGRAIEQKLP